MYMYQCSMYRLNCLVFSLGYRSYSIVPLILA